MDERFPRGFAAFEAQMARHAAMMEKAMAAHSRAIEAMERRMAEARLGHMRAIEAMEARVAAFRSARRPRKPPGRKKRRDEGGEAAPVAPRPKPSPLSGAAAAPIEYER